jgi:hypothetical protein
MGDIENSLVYDTGAAVGIGTTAPQAMLHVVSTTAPAGFVDVYSNTLNSVIFVSRAARGTPANPSAVQTNDVIGGFTGRGYGQTGFSGGRGAMIVRANEPWSDTAQSTYIQFETAPLGQAYQAERMRIDNAGNVGIGTTTPSALLEVNGTAKFDGLVTFASGQTFPGIMTTGAIGAVATQGTPARSSAACAPPQMMYDANYIYTCVATNTWRRAASAAF